MKIEQFVVFFLIETEHSGSDGEVFRTLTMRSVDLVFGDMAAFLDSIPDGDIAKSQMWVSVVAADGKRVEFADGVSSELPGDNLAADVVLMDDEMRQKCKKTARLFADRRPMRDKPTRIPPPTMGDKPEMIA